MNCTTNIHRFFLCSAGFPVLLIWNFVCIFLVLQLCTDYFVVWITRTSAFGGRIWLYSFTESLFVLLERERFILPYRGYGVWASSWAQVPSLLLLYWDLLGKLSLRRLPPVLPMLPMHLPSCHHLKPSSVLIFNPAPSLHSVLKLCWSGHQRLHNSRDSPIYLFLNSELQGMVWLVMYSAHCPQTHSDLYVW